MQYIFGSVVSVLQNDPKKTYTAGDMAFFRRFFEAQTEEQKSLIKALVKNG